MSYFGNAAALLIELLFGLATALFVLRVLLQLVRAGFRNPLSQIVYQASNPVLLPLRRALPTVRGVDTAALAVAFLLQVLKVWLLALLLGFSMNLAGSLVLGLAGLLAFVLTLYFWLLIIVIVVGFLAPDSRHPLLPPLIQLTEPVLRPLRRVIPPLGMFDLSPMVAFIAILLLRVLLVAPLQDFGTLIARSY
jgi:YggT family protein